MQSVKWLGFGLSNSLVRTVVHFFPSCGGVTAPYPANCALELFGVQSENGDRKLTSSAPRRVMLEGARLSQPDGVRLDQAFEELADGVKGYFGIAVELSTTQPKVDLSGSACVVEFASRANSVRYWPKLLQQSNDANAPLSKPQGLALDDVYNQTALVVVNGGATAFRPSLSLWAETQGAAKTLRPEALQRSVSAMEVGSLSVAEILAHEELFIGVANQETSAGALKAAALRVENAAADLAFFILYRDVATKRPVSVNVL